MSKQLVLIVTTGFYRLNEVERNLRRKGGERNALI
jgi:hypothetical protein